jgi:hypothetical protein
MESQLKAFEDYIASLANLGVFPALHRHSNGWTCVLRNSANIQIMPFKGEDACWGESVMDALINAVERLNQRFSEPRQLHKYIDTGIDPRNEAFQTVKSAYTQ